MDSPLDKAYRAARSADAATMAGELKRAAAAHKIAADCFASVAATAPAEVKQLCTALSEHHAARARYLSSNEAQQAQLQAQAQIRAEVSNSQIQLTRLQSTALAQAQINRGYSSGVPLGPGGYGNLGSSGATASIAISNLSTASANIDQQHTTANNAARVATRAFIRAFEAALAAARSEPSESFYLVESQRAEIRGDSTTEVPGLAHAIEAGGRAARVALSDHLASIEEASQSQAENTQTLIDRLRAENDKLRGQVSKHKQRWDELKQSARKRRESEPGSADGAAAAVLEAAFAETA